MRPNTRWGLAAAAATMAVIGPIVTIGRTVDAHTVTTPTSVPDPASGPTGTAAGSTATGEVGGTWEQVTPGEGCVCADGSEWSFFVREADPERVLFVLEGGGACWSPETCPPGAGPYDPDVSPDDHPSGFGGGFDLSNPDNPFADWSMIFVPYCTGDVHIGNAERTYADGLTIQHRGARNGATALAALTERFPDARQVVVAGASAGSIAAPLYAGMVQDRYPEAHVIAFGDGSGGYPTEGGEVNVQLMETWGFEPRIAAWPEAAGSGPGDWNFTRFWSVVAERHPEVEMARFDFAGDAVQLAFIGYAGLPAGDLLTTQEANEAAIEAGGANQQSFVADGDRHTVIGGEDFYDVEVDGTSVAEWVAQVVDQDEPVDDVRCASCRGDGATVTTTTG